MQVTVPHHRKSAANSVWIFQLFNGLWQYQIPYFGHSDQFAGVADQFFLVLTLTNYHGYWRINRLDGFLLLK